MRKLTNALDVTYLTFLFTKKANISKQHWHRFYIILRVNLPVDILLNEHYGAAFVLVSKFHIIFLILLLFRYLHKKHIH